MVKRTSDLIEAYPPCDTNYFDKSLLTLLDRTIKEGYICPNIKNCETAEIYCALKYGRHVAQYVTRGKDLKKVLMDFSKVYFLDKEFWDSKDGKTFRSFQGKALMLKAVEYFARVVLLQNTSQTVLSACIKCGGSKIEKTVTDSIHDGVFILSGKGGVQNRVVEYCLDCDPEPYGGIIESNPDEEDFEKIRKFKQED